MVTFMSNIGVIISWALKMARWSLTEFLTSLITPAQSWTVLVHLHSVNKARAWTGPKPKKKKKECTETCHWPIRADWTLGEGLKETHTMFFTQMQQFVWKLMCFFTSQIKIGLKSLHFELFPLSRNLDGLIVTVYPKWGGLYLMFCFSDWLFG